METLKLIAPIKRSNKPKASNKTFALAVPFNWPKPAA